MKEAIPLTDDEVKEASGEAIDVPAVKEAPKEEAVPAVAASPLDMPVEVFQEALDRRGANRKALIAWVRRNLVDGVDFGRTGKARKPSLWKPGAEKICGMLSVVPTFPKYKEYEDAILRGVQLTHILLRCEIVNSAQQVVGEGAGARSLAQDNGDLNKCLKMAAKSGHIDATLRLAGLSEVFTQDMVEENEGGRDSARDAETGESAKTPPPTSKSKWSRPKSWNAEAPEGSPIYTDAEVGSWSIYLTMEVWPEMGYSPKQIEMGALDKNGLPVYCPECQGVCWPRHPDAKETAPEFKCMGKTKETRCEKGVWWPGKDGNVGQWMSRKDGGFPYRVPEAAK